MPLTPDERAALRQGATRFDVDIDDAILERLGAWLDRVYDWQTRRNVTAVAREQAAERHLLDSLALAPHLPRGARVLDVGSGAGFPGMVLALAREDLRMTLAERSSWLSGRLEEAVAELGLTRVCVLSRNLRPGTVEPAGFEAVVSRAALKLPELMRLARRALRPDGVLLLQLGPQTLESYRSLGSDGFREDARQVYRLCDDVDRWIVRMIRQ